MHTTPPPSSFFAAARSDMPTSSRRVLSMPSLDLADQVRVSGGIREFIWWMFAVRCNQHFVCLYLSHE
jgi:hypothetical protein